MRIGIIGDNKSVLAFRALGVETFGVSNSEQVNLAVEAVRKQDFAILLVTEGAAARYEKELQGLFQAALPACLVIPGGAGSGKAKEELGKILERALGSENLIK